MVAVPGARLPGAHAQRLPRGPGRQLGHPAERVPAEHQEPEAVQGRQGQHPRGPAAARRDHDAARWQRVDHLRQGHQGVGGFQVVQQSGNGWALGGAIAAIFGLAASLFIQRRRVWVRATKGPTA
ncbi:cytochrome c biogenesis protein ResB [Streptomyces chiangmaiensis]